MGDQSRVAFGWETNRKGRARRFQPLRDFSPLSGLLDDSDNHFSHMHAPRLLPLTCLRGLILNLVRASGCRDSSVETEGPQGCRASVRSRLHSSQSSCTDDLAAYLFSVTQLFPLFLPFILSRLPLPQKLRNPTSQRQLLILILSLYLLYSLAASVFKVVRQPTFYDVLSLPRNAGTTEVSQGWKAFARRNHPDRRGGEEGAEDVFRVGRVAYDTLNDDVRRWAYDRCVLAFLSSSPLRSRHKLTSIRCWFPSRPGLDPTRPTGGSRARRSESSCSGVCTTR